MAQDLERKKIGDVLIERGLIRKEWVEEILQNSRTKALRFGESAIDLGYVKKEAIEAVLSEPYQKEFIFHLEALYYPRATKDLIPLDQIVRWGILPLGFKSEFHWFRSRKRLNVGLVNCTQRKADQKEIEAELESEYPLKFYSILPDEYLMILDSVYGLKKDALLGPNSNLHEIVQIYLQLESGKPPQRKQV